MGVLAGEPETQGTGIYGVSVQDLQQIPHRACRQRKIIYRPRAVAVDVDFSPYCKKKRGTDAITTAVPLSVNHQKTILSKNILKMKKNINSCSKYQ